MLDQALHQAALDFARALQHAQSVAAYRAATQVLEADPGAQAILADMREQQPTIMQLQQNGQSPTQAQVDAFRRSQEAIRTCETIMAHLGATSEVKAFLPVVARRITTSLGFDYAQIVAPKGCC
jgi:cell fate (sporulation/competence/biofilm development) regulator YlbF (YheA/YmcA/DUF963 family)